MVQLRGKIKGELEEKRRQQKNHQDDLMKPMYKDIDEKFRQASHEEITQRKALNDVN